MKGLTRARKAAGMRMRELAQHAGVSITSIYRYEHGLRKPTAEILLKLAQALNCKMEELMSE